MFGKYYIASKFRFTMFMAITVLIIAMILGAVFGTSVDGASVNKAYYIITVQSGDTIAEEYKDAKTDIRKLIYEISDLNDLEDAHIYIGQQLLIPA